MESPANVNATYYQYTLLQKITYSPVLMKAYIALGCIFLIGGTLLWGLVSLIYQLISIPIILWLHYVITRSILLLSQVSFRKKWRFRLALPWSGFLPQQYVQAKILRKVQRHLSWLCLCVIAILYPWFPLPFVICALFWHIWLTAPRLIILSRFRRQPKDGILRITANETLYYKS